MKASNWKEVWEYRADTYSGASAAIIDGFDSGRGKMTNESLGYLLAKISELLDLRKSDMLLEVGCGAGMILEKLNIPHSHIAGVDYSFAMIREAKARVPKGTFCVAEACDLPFKKASFNKILVWSVFQYFPNFEYARKVLYSLMYCLKNPGIVLIGDVPDLAKCKEAANLENNNPHKFKEFELNNNLTHLYYERSFFCDFVMKHGCEISICDLLIPDYLNSQVRFTVLLKSSEAAKIKLDND